MLIDDTVWVIKGKDHTLFSLKHGNVQFHEEGMKGMYCQSWECKDGHFFKKKGIIHCCTHIKATFLFYEETL